MTVDEDDEEEGGAPIAMLEAIFAAHGWPYERRGDEELGPQAPGSWAQVELRGVWRGDDRVLQFLALPDIRVASDKRAAIYETLGLINEQLWVGHFELWSSSGAVLFRHALLLDGEGGDAVLGQETAETLIDSAIDECERFFPVFQFVLWGDKSPKEAIEAALIDTRGEA